MGTSVFAISMVKDEADIVEGTIRHMLEQVDEVIVLDNASTDGTREILGELPITVVDDPEPAYYQSVKMSHLAEMAAERGARWVVPFDADERWQGSEGTVADVLYDCDADIASAALFDHVATSLDDEQEPDPVKRLRWRRREALGLPKVAVRALSGLTIHQGNHGASFPSVRHPRVVEGRLEVRHFPYRTPEQFVSKVRNGAAAYAATDLPEGTGIHWREYGRHLEERGEQAVIDDIFLRYFFAADPEHDPTLVFDPA